MTQSGIQTIGHKEPSKINSGYLSEAWESMYTLLVYALTHSNSPLRSAHWSQWLTGHSRSLSVCATNMPNNISLCHMSHVQGQRKGQESPCKDKHDFMSNCVNQS